MKQAFTLVELAIVLVIIGLIVGGVLVGQDLIEQAKLRATVRQVSDTDTAVLAFRNKYNGLPGDLKNASQFGLNTHTAEPGNGGSNGNGNGSGVLDHYDCYCFDGEIANFFVHLSNAQMTKGSYAEVDGCKASDSPLCNGRAGQSFPATAVGTGLVAVPSQNRLWYVLGVTSTIIDPDGDTFDTEGAEYSLLGDTLTPIQAYGIDSKIDDGNPSTGSVQAVGRYGWLGYHGLGSDLTLGASDCMQVVGTYNATLNDKVCTLGIRSSAGG